MRVSRRTALWPGLAVVGALALAGCDVGGDGDESDDPATIAPADAALYADAVVRPEGDQKERANAFLSRVLDDDDPGERIEKLIDRAFKDAGEKATFAEDVEPWLGERAAVFVTGYEDDPPAVVAVSSDDPDTGIELLQSESVRTSERDYEGVDYQLDEEDNAFGAIEDFVVFGDEPAFKAAVDASEGDSLSDSDEYSDAVDALDDDAIATAYINTEGIARQVAQEEDAPEDAVKAVFGPLGEGAAAAGVTVTDDQLTADVTAPAEGEGEEAATSALLESLPSEAFAAIGVNDINGTIKRIVDQVESAGIPNLGEGDIAKQLQERFDIDLQSDLLSWLDEGALFLTGTSLEDLGGALVLGTRDQSASAGFLAKLATLIQREREGTAKLSPLELPPGVESGGETGGTAPGTGETTEETGGETGFSIAGGEGFNVTDPALPAPVHVVQHDDRFVIGYQDAPTAAAFATEEPLERNEAFLAARDALGSDHPIDFFLSFQPILALLDASAFGDDPRYVAAKRYVRGVDFLGGGSATSDDRTDTRVVVGVK